MTVDLRAFIRDIPDFPEPGIVFRDITPLLADAGALDAALEGLAAIARPLKPTLPIARKRASSSRSISSVLSCLVKLPDSA